MANDNTTRVLELLGQQHGVERRTFCLIDGFPYVLWSNGQHPTPSGGFGGRTGLVCLNPPDTEWSLGLDLKKAKADASALTIGLRNIEDPDDPTKRFFAKLFAPARFSASGSNFVLFARNDTIRQIDADAETIPVDRSLADWDNGGLAYIGSEVFRYTKVYDYPAQEGDALAEFQGVTKGQFPCVGTTWGFTYTPRSGDGDETTTQADGIVIASVPVTWIGRRFALYITCWDPARGAYLPLSESLLAWVGSTSEGISYRADGDQWLLSGENVLKQCDSKIATDIRRAELNGCYVADNAAVRIHVFDATAGMSATITVPLVSDLYGAVALARSIASEFNDLRHSLGNWDHIIGYADADVRERLSLEILIDSSGDGEKIVFRFLVTGTNGLSGSEIQIRPTASGFDRLVSGNVLHIVGLSPDSGASFDGGSGEYYADIIGEEPYCVSFHSTQNIAGRGGNDLLCYIKDMSGWTTQADTAGAAILSLGDDETTVGYFTGKIAGSSYDDADTDLKTYVAQFASVEADGPSPGGLITLRNDGYAMLGYKMPSTSSYGAPWIGHRSGEEPATITLCYFPVSMIMNLGSPRGPFEVLLYSLLSTGTTGYNHETYDVLPRHLSVGVQADLVDIESFLDADRAIIAKSFNLAMRGYPITEAIQWSELLRAECQLFGYSLTWDTRAAKLRIRSFVQQESLSTADEVNDSNSANHREFPDMMMSSKTTCNQWTAQFRDHLRDKDIKRELFDGVGLAATGYSTGETIKHRGVNLHNSSYSEAELFTDLSRVLITGRKDLFRSPWPTVRRTLSPSMTGRISVGDTIRFIATNMPDPFGSGDMSCDCWALVIDRTQSFTDYKGTCTLLLYSQSGADSRANWAASAVVDNDAANGGWDSTNKYLYLLGGAVCDQWGTEQVSRGYPDGSRFVAGDKVNIIARNPDDPTSAQSWTALTVAEDYGEDHPSVLTLDAGTTLTGYDTTGATEYIVVSADYASAATTQQLDQAYTADDDTKRIDLARARRYG